MSAKSPGSYSLLCRRLRLSRNVIPLLMSVGAFIFEAVEHGASPFGWTPSLEVLILGIIGPGATALVLTWLLHRVKERDEAEARLAVVTAHERELLNQLERSLRAERFGLVPTLDGILAAVCVETSMAGGAVYLVSQTDGALLPATVSWPSAETGPLLAEGAQRSLPRENGARAVGESPAQVAGMAPDQQILAVPIADRGETLGLLVLSGAASDAAPDPGVLGVVAGAMALLIRNNQLYARLQSQAVIDERNELAREVHDGLAQSLGFLNFKTQQVKRLLDRGETSEAVVAVDELCQGSQEVYEEVRVLIRSLRSSTGVSGGLVASLQSYTAVLARRTGLEITVEAASEPSLSPQAQLQLFRVVQEALSNAHKHGMARHVRIRLADGPDCVNLTVEDDGLGLTATGPRLPDADQRSESTAGPKPDGHFGLTIMRERLQSIGGDLHVESRPDAGTIVRIRVPNGCVEPGEEGPPGES